MLLRRLVDLRHLLAGPLQLLADPRRLIAGPLLLLLLL